MEANSKNYSKDANPNRSRTAIFRHFRCSTRRARQGPRARSPSLGFKGLSTGSQGLGLRAFGFEFQCIWGFPKIGDPNIVP